MNDVIKTILQDDDLGIRITKGGRWLVWYQEQWTVFESKRYAKKSKIIYQGGSYMMAIEALIEEVQNEMAKSN